MRCIICGGDEWENVDQYRLKPSKMNMCKKCGFVSYPERYKTTDAAKEYYKKDYRNAPSVNNYFSGQKKSQYHVVFLKDLFDRWTNESKTPVVCDVGAAIGMFLKLVKDFFPEAKLYGTEWGENFRKHAFYEYGILLTEDFDDTKKYDLISNYKVLEHQCDADLELKRYADCLNDGGYIYLSVPTWFHTMHSGSMATWDVDDKPGIEYYYHPDHINVWSRNHVYYLIQKSGLVIEKENRTYYDDTFLLRKPLPNETLPIVELTDNPLIIKCLMERIKTASDFYVDGKFKEATDTFPNFCRAWVMYYEMNRKKFHELGYNGICEQVLNPAIAACPDTAEIYLFATDIAMRYDQFEKAIEFSDKALQMKPNSPVFLRNLSHAFRQLAHRERDLEKKYKLFNEARNVMRFLSQISIEHYGEAVSWMMQDHAYLPLPKNISGK